MKKLLIGLPLHHGVCDAFRRGYGELMRAQVVGWEARWYEMGGGGITVARNHMASLAIREGYDVLLFLAGDTGFKDDKLSEQVARVLSHFERPDVNCVGGVYLFKKFPLRLCVSQDENRVVDEFGLIEVKEAGTDFMAIRVAAMSKIIADWDEISRLVYDANVPLEYDSNNGNADRAQFTEWNLFGQAVVWEKGEARFLPEDFYWCRLAREAGFRIQVDTQIRLQHWGTHNFDANRATGIDEALATRMPPWHGIAT